MAGTGVAVASGDLTPINDPNGSSQYIIGRNNARDIRSGQIGLTYLSGSDGYTPRPGVLVRSLASNDLKVDPQVSPNGTVIVRKGAAIIPRTGQGAYIFNNEADQNVTFPAASAVNPRYDVLCCAAFDKGAFVGDAAHGPQFWIEQGVVSGSPTVPATPTGMLKLAEVLRAVNDNTISTEIADKRTSTSLHNPVRTLLPGDSLADPGVAVGELRYVSHSGAELWTGALWVAVGRPSYASIASIPAALSVFNSLVYHTGLKRMIRHNGTNWDQNYDTDVLAMQQASQTSDQIITSAVDLAGASITFTVVNPSTVVKVDTTFDIGLSSGFFVGSLLVDGVAQGKEAHGGDVSRGTFSQTYRIPLAAGAHTLKLRGATTGAAGTVYGTHTNLMISTSDR